MTSKQMLKPVAVDSQKLGYCSMSLLRTPNIWWRPPIFSELFFAISQTAEQRVVKSISVVGSKVLHKKLSP